MMKHSMQRGWSRWALGAVVALGFLFAGGAPASAHDVKDPVCRMTVDSDTAKWKHKLGNKSFYFCSQQCVVKFKGEPAKYEKLAALLEKGDLHEYTVELETSPNPVAGKPVELAFAVKYKESGKLVTDFEVIHERLFHLLMVTRDLRWFEHQHPVRGEDGVFRKTWTFPVPGEYTLYADFTPSDGDNQVIPLPLTIGGGEGRTVALSPSAKRVMQVGDLRFELKIQGEPLRMERPALLTYTVKDRRGRPVRNMQPFIGAMGHLLAISQNGQEVVHTHALTSPSQPSMHGEKEPFRVTPAMVTEKGPSFSFKLTVPTGGLYKTWAQFVHNNRVYTVPFTFLAEDLWGSVAKTTPAATSRGAQRATVVIDGEYLPAKVSVKAGQPVALTFVLKEKAGCGEVLQFPSLGIKRKLKPGQKTVVTFTPKKSGMVPFTCGMEMYKGQVAVR